MAKLFFCICSLALLGLSSAALSNDKWTYCTSHGVTNAPGCFPTLEAAEAWMKNDSSTAPQGRRFLELSGDPSLYPTANNPTGLSFTYSVKDRPPLSIDEEYLKALSTNGNPGAACGCVNGTTPDCYSATLDCPSHPEGQCYWCPTANGNTGPIIDAMLAAFGQHCDLDIKDQTPWPEPPTFSRPLHVMNGVLFPNGTGSFNFTSGNVLPPSPMAPFNKRIQVSYRQRTVNGCAQNLSIYDFVVIRTQKYTCDAGLFPLNAPTNAQNYYPASQVVSVHEVCRSGATGTITSRIAPANQCEYGNPCIPSTGAKVLHEVDFQSGDLEIARTYNSLRLLRSNSLIGPAWHQASGPRLVPKGSVPYPYILLISEQGEIERFNRNTTTGDYRSVNDQGSVLRPLSIGWQLEGLDRMLYTFDQNRRLTASEKMGMPGSRLTYSYHEDPPGHPDNVIPRGALSAITDSKGRALLFHYSPINQPTLAGTGDPCDGSNAAGACRSIRIAAVQLPDEQLIIYSYDSNGNLSNVKYPGNYEKTYHYNEPTHICPAHMTGACASLPPDGGFPHALTGISEASGSTPARVSNYHYDDRGRIISSGGPNNEGLLTLAYTENPTEDSATLFTSMDYAGTLGSQRKINFTTQNGIFRKDANWIDSDPIDQTVHTTSFEYDGLGRTSGIEDPIGTETTFTYSTDNFHRSSTTEGLGTTEERTATTEWNTTFNLPAEETVEDSFGTPEKRTQNVYNARGQVTSRKNIDPVSLSAQEWTYQYCESADVIADICPTIGLLVSVDGPAQGSLDVSEYIYRLDTVLTGCGTGGTCHRRGDLWKITNALGHVTEHVRYDRSGRVTRIKDANAVLTDLVYHARGWLIGRTVRALVTGVPNIADSTTTFSYEPTGLVSRITQPDGDYIEYSYDDAQRLTGIEDAAGNSVTYTLDAAGNRTHEETHDPSNALRRRLAREYNTLGRLVKERDAIIDGANPNGRLVSEHGYDGNGNRTHTIDGLGRRTDHEYDPLNRLARTLDALNPRGIAEYEYDARDNLVQVTDPKGLITEYVYDGLGDLRELRSPDTGTTVYEYDSAGNRTRQTDARGVVTDYTYDALNRLTAIDYPSDPTLDVSFVYDQSQLECGLNSAPIGRLSKIIDSTGETRLCYDRRGNLAIKTFDDGVHKDLTTSYRYTRADRLAGMTYPRGREIEWQRDTTGRVSMVRHRATSLSAWTTLVSGVTYYPFGPLASLTFGNGRTLSKAYDANYAIHGIDSSGGDGLNLDVDVDVLGNIVSLTPTAPGSGEQERAYDYDALYRLTEVRDSNNALIEAFAYDATGNRTSRQQGAVTDAYAYPVDSHRLSSVAGVPRTYDDAGNLAQIVDSLNAETFTYGANNRMATYRFGSLANGADYAYNGQGERVCKWVDGQQIRYMYDSGGRVLGEYIGNTITPAEYIYIDELPVAVFTPAGLAYIETDHLGTPRALVDAGSNQVIWRWPLTGSAFGDHVANEDADANTVPTIFNLRFPGQQYDAESGLHYNYFRDYESGTGRYVQSDPIGLRAGLNTFSYVSSAPINRFDPKGLVEIDRSCFGCDQHGDKAERLKKAAQLCIRIASTFTNAARSRCIQRRCEDDGIVVCDQAGRCPPGKGGSNMWHWMGPSTAFYAFPVPEKTINVCFKNISDSPELLGTIVLHEFAHSCGWRHEDNENVP